MGLDFVLRCMAAGHNVRWFRSSKTPCRDGDGFGIRVVDRWQDHMKECKDGLILTTMNSKYLFELDDYRRFGWKNIMGPTVKSASLEKNRSEGMQMMERAGHNIPPYKTFDTLQAAKKHVLKTDSNYCLKPAGDCDDKATTFASKNPAQMVEWINNKIKRGWNPKGPVLLQDKIEFISEIGIAGYMGPDGFLPDKFEVSREYKKLASGEFGCTTGEMGTVTQYVHSDPLVDILMSLEPVLVALGHTGDFAIGGCIDTKGEFQFFEVTARQGYPDSYIRTEMNKGDPAEWMRSMMNGKDTLRVSYDPHIGIVCAQRPFPYSDGGPTETEGKPIYGIDDNWDSIHPVQLFMDKGYTMTGDAVTTGTVYRTSGGYVMVATASGSTVSKARKTVFDTINQIEMADLLARDDVGESLESELPKLHQHGFWKDMEF